MKEWHEFLYLDRIVQDRETSRFWNYLSQRGGELLAQRRDNELADLLGLE